jgi:hypothetical protein
MIMIKYILALNLILFCYGDIFAQPTSRNPLDKILSLQPSPIPTKEDCVNMTISELYSYGDAFKYYKELAFGKFEIELNERYLIIKIIRDANEVGIEKSIFKDFIKFEIEVSKNTKKNEITGFKMIDFDKYVDVIKLEVNVFKSISMNPVNNFFYVPVNQKDHLLWDKNILNGVVASGPTRILNRERTRTFLQTSSNQPCDLFSDATDGVIVPDFGGSKATLFTIDKDWRRLIYCDKDFQPQSGQTRFRAYNNSSNGADFSFPTSIAASQVFQSSTYKLYVTDYNSQKIKVLTYNTTNYTLYNNPSSISVTSYPYDIGFHFGSSLVYDTDDKLWYSTDNPTPALKCITTSGTELASVTQFNWRGQTFALNPDRIDVFTGMHPNYYYKERGMIAIVDKVMNCVIYIRLTENGELFTNPPEAFWVQSYPHKITSVQFINNLPYSSDPASVLVSGNNLDNNDGFLFMSKVRFRPENNGTFLIPYLVDYLASAKTSFDGSNTTGSLITPYFKNMNNTESNIGFTDIFTSEAWNNETGMRRLKPGADIVGQTIGNYCFDYKTVGINIKTTSPVNVRIAAYVRNPSIIGVPISKVNGSNLQISNGMYTGLVPSGSNYFNIQINLNSIPAIPKVFFTVSLIPQDESFNNNSIYNHVIPLETPIIQQCSSPGGCPYVSVLDSAGFKLDNNLLHKSEFSWNIGNDITDKYLLNIPPSTEDSIYSFRINELDNDFNYFDQFRLIAVDHPQGTKIGITENNDIVTYIPEYVDSPLSSFLNDDDVTDDVAYDTSGYIEGGGDDNLSSEFGDNNNVIQSFLNIVSGIIKKYPLILNTVVADSAAIILDPDRPINPISHEKDYLGTIYAFDTQSDYASPPIIISRRENKTNSIVPVGQNVNIDSVYVDFNNEFSLSYFATTTIFYGGYIERELPLISADHSKLGDVKDLLFDEDTQYATLDNEDYINLNFKDTSEALEEGWIRDYIFVTRGRYEVSEGDNLLRITDESNIPKEYSLYQNYPNPFNPITNIKFDLPNDEFVKIKIYDILGREMFNLVNELKTKGTYQLQFDGSKLASGIYFYRIEAGSFVQTKRMVLVK